MMSQKSYQYRVIKSGAITEIYAYEETRTKRVKEAFDLIDEEIEEKRDKQVFIDKQVSKHDYDENYRYTRREDNIKALKKKLNRMVHSNVGRYEERDKFITLTFATEDGQSPTREEVQYKFKKFLMRMKYHGRDFEYISVIEKGTRGTKRLHIHLLAFNFPYMKIETLREYWKYGKVDIVAIQNIEVCSYLTKYVEKQLEDGTIGKGERFYTCSKGIKRPVEIYLTSNEMIEQNNDLTYNQDLCFQFDFSSEYVGNVKYYKFVDYEVLNAYTDFG